MRFLFLLILLAGVGLGVGYPWYVNNFSGEELGTYHAFERGAGFKPVEVELKASDAPVRVLVDLTSVGSPRFSADRTVLTLTAAAGGRTVLADTLTFWQSTARDAAPQMQDRIFRADSGPITDIADGAYTFTLGQGDADGIDIRAVDLVLRGGALVLDPRAMPIGFSLIAVGLIGLVLAMRRRRTPQANPNSQPPPPRWGRGGSQ
ncbi:MAG: hypothetical protein AB7P20_11710 [Rhizobiaceae bacterium]